MTRPTHDRTALHYGVDTDLVILISEAINPPAGTDLHTVLEYLHGQILELETSSTRVYALQVDAVLKRIISNSYTADAAIAAAGGAGSFTANAVSKKTVLNTQVTTNVTVEHGDFGNSHHNYRTNTNYASLVAGTYVGSANLQSHIGVGQRLSAGNYYSYESFLAFDTDTAGIPSGATINSAFLELYGRTDNSTTDFTANAYAYNWSSNSDFLKASDLAALTLVATWPSTDYAASYRRFTDVALASAIVTNAKTRLILASARYVAGTTPSGEERVEFRDGFDGDVGNTWPRLVITYTTGTPFALDAVIVRGFSGTFTANSVIGKTLTSTFTADAVVKGTLTATATADAVVMPVFTANAVISLGTGTGSFNAEAIKLRTESFSLTVDAVVNGTVSASLTGDAVVMPSFTADAEIFIPDTSLTALKWRSIDGSVAEDNVLPNTPNIKLYEQEKFR